VDVILTSPTRRRRPQTPATQDGRQARTDATKRAILAAATDAFALQGYAGTSISDVATKAHISVGLIYYHFDSKEGLFSAIWQQYQADQERRIRKALRNAQSAGVNDPLELLDRSAEAYLRGAWEARAVVRMAHVRDTPPIFAEDRSLANQRWLQRNRRLLEGGNPALAETVLAALLGSIGALCADLADVNDPAEADSSIERAMRVIRAIVGTLAQS
jgi:AcrR family transcriptional regulator